MIKETYERAWKYWLSVPWYKKIAYSVVLVGVAVFWLISRFTDRGMRPTSTITALDKHQEEKVNEMLEVLTKKEKEMEKDITKKKQDIAELNCKLTLLDELNTKKRISIEDAKTMDELDAIQKKWDL